MQHRRAAQGSPGRLVGAALGKGACQHRCSSTAGLGGGDQRNAAAGLPSDQAKTLRRLSLLVHSFCGTHRSQRKAGIYCVDCCLSLWEAGSLPHAGLCSHLRCAAVAPFANQVTICGFGFCRPRQHSRAHPNAAGPCTPCVPPKQPSSGVVCNLLVSQWTTEHLHRKQRTERALTASSASSPQSAVVASSSCSRSAPVSSSRSSIVPSSTKQTTEHPRSKQREHPRSRHQQASRQSQEWRD